MNLLEILRKYPCRYRSEYMISKEEKKRLTDIIDEDWRKIFKREIMLKLTDRIMEKLELQDSEVSDSNMIRMSVDCFVFTKDEMMAFIKVIEDELYAEKQSLIGNKIN